MPKTAMAMSADMEMLGICCFQLHTRLSKVKRASVQDGCAQEFIRHLKIESRTIVNTTETSQYYMSHR